MAKRELIDTGSEKHMPSKATLVGFVLGSAIATAGAWFFIEFSLKEVAGFFLSMLLGGSIYFLIRERD